MGKKRVVVKRANEDVHELILLDAGSKEVSGKAVKAGRGSQG